MSQHTIITTIPVGDPDLGAEVECEITFTYYQGRMAHMTAGWKGGYPHPDEADEVEFVKAVPLCNGKPSPYYGAFANMEQAALDDLAADWLVSDDGMLATGETIASDNEAAREYAAELRADR